MQHSKEFVELVNEAREQINECDVHTVKRRLDDNEDFVLLDVREESEYASAALPRARHISRGMLEVKVVQNIPEKNTELVLYCGGGYRSALAAASLVKMGYTNVTSMDGGFRAWKEAGYPVVQG